jgi:imidazolonepropionase-like amidohydrolase
MSKVLIADRVITGGDEAPIGNGAVRIEDERIVAVGPASQVGARPGDEVIELPGCTLLPGLIDCHEHLSGHDRYAIGDDSVREADIMFALVGTYHARRLLDIGVTTARIPGAPGHIDLFIRRAIQEGYLSGPKLICAGRHLSMTGGHGSMSGIEVDGADEARKAVRLQMKAGADFIKIVASGGVGITRPGEEPSQPELTVEEMSAAVDAAHSAGKRVTAHADGVPGIQNAIDAGVDCIEHGIYLTRAQAEQMAERGIALVPTLSTMVGIYERGIEYGMPGSWIPIAEAVLEPHRESFQNALDAGVHFATGTDGFGDIVEEIRLFTTFGLDNHRAIQAATRDAALVCSPRPDFGTLEPGKTADLLAVTGDPLQAVEALRRVRLVTVDGMVVRENRP